MKTYVDYYPQSEPTNWHIWSILSCVLALTALTGFTSPLDGLPPAPIDETVDATDVSDFVIPTSNVLPKMKCAQCGVVSSLREVSEVVTNTGAISPHKDLRKTYEVTVQMRNGSQHVIRDPGSSIWHIGERMIVIGGV